MSNLAAPSRRGLRQINLAAVIDAIYDEDPPPSRAVVADRTGLTKSTVSTLVDRLIAARLVRELPVAAGMRVGRPGVPLGPMPQSILGLGLEVNVDYYGGRLIDLSGTVVAEHIVPAELEHSDPAAVLGDLGRLAKRLVARVGRRGMVVAGARLALPGLVREGSAVLEVAANLGWRNVEPVPMLGPIGLDTRVRNEANLAGLAQTPMRVAMGERDENQRSLTSFVYVSGNVGIGSAIVIDGRLFAGQHGFSGEIGHLIVDPGGRQCGCGNRGCLEQYAGRAAIMRGAGLEPHDDFEHVLTNLEAGDPQAEQAVAMAAESLGRALSDCLNILDVTGIVLGGIYVRLFTSIAATIERAVNESVLFAVREPIDVRPAPRRDYAALTGGAREVLHGVLADPARWTKTAPHRRADVGGASTVP